MSKGNGEKIKFVELWHFFLMVALPLICVGGASLIPYKLRLPLIYLTGVMLLAIFIFSGKKVKLHPVNVSMLLLVVFIAIQTLYSYDPKSTLNLLILYACGTTLLFIDIPENVIHKIITIMYVFCLVIALSIIISIFVDNCMLTYFKFIVNPNNTPSVTQAIQKAAKLQ